MSKSDGVGEKENYKGEEWSKERKVAPFDNTTGSLESYYIPDCHTLQEVSEPFDAELLVVNFDKGWRSAWRIVWEDVGGKTYPMFASEFIAMVKKFYNAPCETFPRVNAKWRVVKRGSNYGISFMERIIR